MTAALVFPGGGDQTGLRHYRNLHSAVIMAQSIRKFTRFIRGMQNCIYKLREQMTLFFDHLHFFHVTYEHGALFQCLHSIYVSTKLRDSPRLN